MRGNLEEYTATLEVTFKGRGQEQATVIAEIIASLIQDAEVEIKEVKPRA